MHKNEKWLILGIIVCLLVFIVGYSFAYFTSNVITSGSGSSSSGNTAELITTKYDAGSSKLVLTDAVPGDSASKTFSVQVTPTEYDPTAKYNINLNINSNNFEVCSSCTDKEELVYTLYSCTDSSCSSTTQLIKSDLTNSITTTQTYSETKTPNTMTTYYYKVTITFRDISVSQNHNANKSFDGTIDVVYAQ